MTLPEPIPYVSVNAQNAIDASQLRTLAICHYVCGGLEILFGTFFIIYVVMGIAWGRGAFPPPASGQPPPPTFIGYIFAGMGGCAVICGWALGILTIMSGRAIANHRRRVFSLVMAGVSCAWFPFGTLLGIFTFIVLLRPSVRIVYEALGSNAG
jgi:hypothetical protein